MRRPGGRAAAEIPLSGPHGASLATTAGITSVISGVMAIGLLAQTPDPGDPAGSLAGVTAALLVGAAIGLYVARHRVCLALDWAPLDPEESSLEGARALGAYHGGMAALFAGLAVGVVWRIALVHGAFGWLAAAAAGLGGLGAMGQALHYRRVARLRARRLAEPTTLHIPLPDPLGTGR